jgi:predicted aspartyl protease
MRRISIVAVVAAVVLMASEAAAEIYKWTDDGGHAHYSEGLDSVPERFRARATPLGLRNAPVSASAPSAARPGPAGQASIRYTPGERIMVDARINGSHSVRLLLDTGADRTLIAPRALVASGVSLARDGVKGSITGVTGTAQVQGVRIDSLEVGEARVSPLLVISYDMGQAGYDGLLGRDFLEQFNVTMDAARGLVTLAPK